MKSDTTQHLDLDAVVRGGVVYAWGDRAWCSRFRADSTLGRSISAQLGIAAHRPVPHAIDELMRQAEALDVVWDRMWVRTVERAAFEACRTHGDDASIELADTGLAVRARYVLHAIGLAKMAGESWIDVSTIGPLGMPGGCVVLRGARWMQVIAPVVRGVAVEPGAPS